MLAARLGTGAQIDDDRRMWIVRGARREGTGRARARCVTDDARSASRGTGRARRAVAGAAGAMLAWSAVACSADPGSSRAGAAVPQAAPDVPARAPKDDPVPEYVLGEPERRPPGTAVALEGGSWGVLLDGVRVVTSDAGNRVASEAADAALVHVEPIPARLGGGFLFRTRTSIFTSATFDGPLRPVATVPASIAVLSFGPDALLVRGSGGERWVFDLATGARKAPAPLGLVDVAALDDGRAIAITEGGGAQLSTDGGKTWRDARGHLRGTPASVVARAGDLWLTDRLPSAPRALRMDAAGAFADLGVVPPAPGAPKQDARFRSGESPLRAALRTGARVGPWTAVVAAGGDVMRVDLATGAIASTVPGVVPQAMTCEAVTVPDDVLLVCAEHGKASVVVSGVLHRGGPRVERSFTADGPFFASEDGALAFGGPCSAQGGDAPASACVRNADGQWEPFALADEEDTGDTGTAPGPTKGTTPAPASATTPAAPAPANATSTATPAPANAATTAAPPGKVQRAKPRPSPAPTGTSAPAPARREVLRWIPRAGRPPVALLLAGNDLATYDAAWGEHRTWQTAGLKPDLVQALRQAATAQRGHDRPFVDRRWLATPTGGVRALLDDGRGVEVSPDGAITVWPFTFHRVAIAGARAFARSVDGRALQTLDHGRTWGEVLAPPTTRTSTFDPRACSALGCDLGAWLRLGWEPTPPAARPEPTVAPRPPARAPAPLLELACLVTSSGEARAVQPTPFSPDDLGLGATRIPFAADGSFDNQRRPFARSPVNVALGQTGTAAETAPRGFFHGPRLTLEPSDRPDDPIPRLATDGPSRSASSFRKELLFVEPLVPGAPIRRVSFGVDALAKAGKPLGVAVAQLVDEGSLEPAAVVPVTPPPLASKATAAAAGDVLASFSPTSAGTLYVLARGGSAPRADLLFARPGGIVQSAAHLAGGDLLALAVADDGAGTLLRFAGGSVSEVAQIPAPPDADFAPANPDAIAVGPKGDLAVLRTPSGSEPPTAEDPALLLLPGARIVALAPWSTAVSADDPSCANDPQAYRATIQTVASWVRVAGRAFPDGATSGMTARVRWSPTRVCVEAIEVPESIGTSPSFTQTETFAIATFAPSAAGRATIEIGSEARAPLSCALAPR